MKPGGFMAPFSVCLLWHQGYCTSWTISENNASLSVIQNEFLDIKKLRSVVLVILYSKEWMDEITHAVLMGKCLVVLLCFWLTYLHTNCVLGEYHNWNVYRVSGYNATDLSYLSYWRNSLPPSSSLVLLYIFPVLYSVFWLNAVLEYVLQVLVLAWYITCLLFDISLSWHFWTNEMC